MTLRDCSQSRNGSRKSRERIPELSRIKTVPCIWNQKTHLAPTASIQGPKSGSLGRGAALSVAGKVGCLAKRKQAPILAQSAKVDSLHNNPKTTPPLPSNRCQNKRSFPESDKIPYSRKNFKP